ncbi:MAG: DUF917 domain-containing protein [Proteobacteria bacterium]|nr:DUF917 domain-containing protein [Pseudomonadota bacterium]
MPALGADALEPLATGAWILGAGGGGNPFLALLNLRRLLADGARLDLVDPSALADDDAVAMVAGIGAPLVGLERLTDPAMAARPVLRLQERLGVAFRAVMAGEIGGANGLRPFLVAALTGLPVVDADAMGRAFPESQMTSFALAGLPPLPTMLSDGRGIDVFVGRVPDARWMERLSRQVTVELGGVASACRAPRLGGDIRRHGVPGSVSRALAIGRAVEVARRRRDDPVAALVAAERGRLLFRGKVRDVERRATGGFLKGTARLDGLDGDRGAAFALAFRNEYAVAWRDGVVVGTTPDILATLDSDSGEAVGTETLRYGQRLSVIALPAPTVFTTPAGLALTGPRAFGYDVDYLPLSSRA